MQVFTITRRDSAGFYVHVRYGGIVRATSTRDALEAYCHESGDCVARYVSASECVSGDGDQLHADRLAGVR